MILSRSVTCLALLTLLFLAQCATLPVRGDANIIRVLPNLENKPVLRWSVSDVVQWMNHTIGYAEYSDYVRKHLIDGPTLLEMVPADFESFFPITNPLHVIKIQAHIKLLRGQCLCHGTATVTNNHEFWNYMKQNSVRTWVEGTTALYFSRVAMLGAFLLDHQFYIDVISSGKKVEDGDDEVGNVAVNLHSGGTGLRFRKLVYWISWVFAPDLYLAYQTAKLCTTNYILMPFMLIHFITQAGNEYFLLYSIYHKIAFTPETSILGRIWGIYAYTVFAPVAGIVVGYVFPVILQRVCVAALVVHNLVILLGLLVLVLFRGNIEAPQGKDTNKSTQEAKVDTDPNMNNVGDKNTKSAEKID